MKIMAIDIGGTCLKAGIFEDGALTDVRELPHVGKPDGRSVIRRTKELIYTYREQHEFSRIGISTAGQVDPADGHIIYANANIPLYTGTRIKSILEETFGLPTSVDNSVRAAALGEHLHGAARGIDNFLCVCYGAGIGGAIFSRGELYTGANCLAGEFGGIITHSEHRNPAADLFSGCYERYASCAALIRRAQEIKPELTTGREVFRHINEPAVHAIVDLWIMEIVYGLVTIIHSFNPSCLILGGGVMEQPYVQEYVRTRLFERIMPGYRGMMLSSAGLGSLSALWGAAENALKL